MGHTLASLHVPGWPKPKGSMVPIVVAGRYKGMREDIAGSREWRLAVRKALWLAMPELRRPAHVPEAGPVMVTLDFRYPRSCLADERLAFPTRRAGRWAHGDLDKLERNVLDALVDAHLIKDDSLVAGISGVKRWTGPDEKPGAWILVERA